MILEFKMIPARGPQTLFVCNLFLDSLRVVCCVLCVVCCVLCGVVCVVCRVCVCVCVVCVSNPCERLSTGASREAPVDNGSWARQGTQGTAEDQQFVVCGV